MSTDKKKILICITKGGWGGAQKYVYDLATHLSKDFDVTVVFGEPGLLKDKLTEKLIRTITLDNAIRDTSIKKDISLLFELIKIFKSEKPDIVHLNSSKIGFVGSLAVFIINGFGLKTKSSQLKAIFTAHGWAFNEDRPWWQKFIFWAIQAKTVFFCDKTIAVSKAVRNQLWPKWLQKKIAVIHNGIDEEKILTKSQALEILSSKINTDIRDKKIIGTISELHKNKGLKYLIKAVSLIDRELVRDYIFVIVGEGEEREKLQIFINKKRLNDKVLMVGRIENARKILNAFDIFTLTSITEAFPYVLLEAGLAGLPVIASDVGGIPEIIENNKTGFTVEPRNCRKISEAIEYLIKNEEISHKMGANLKDKVKKQFNTEEMITKTLKIYGIIQ